MEETATPAPAIHEADFTHPGYEAIHNWFSLTYANYLVLHRTQLQSMPEDWQQRFVKCLEQLHEAFEGMPTVDGYRVQAVNSEGKFTKDPMPHYNRGRTRLPIYPFEA